jgi:hypothetical protein
MVRVFWIRCRDCEAEVADGAVCDGVFCSLNVVIHVYGTCFSMAVCTLWRSWLRHRATRWKFAGSIPDVFIGTFYGLYPSGRTMALGSS